MINQGRVSEIVENLVSLSRKPSEQILDKLLQDLYPSIDPENKYGGFEYQGLDFTTTNTYSFLEPKVKTFAPRMKVILDDIQERYYNNVTLPSEWLGTLLRNAIAVALSAGDLLNLLPDELHDLVRKGVRIPENTMASISPREVMAFKQDNEQAITSVRKMLSRQALGVI